MPVSHISNPKCKTKLQEMIEGYNGGHQAYYQNTRPLHSVQSLQADVVQPDIPNARALAIFRAGQTLNFFSYGISSTIVLSGDPNFPVTQAETTNTKANETNNSDFAIDWIGLSHRGNKVSYAGNPFGDTDPGVLAAMLGRRALIDPFNYRMPLEFSSPALLENAVFQELLKYVTLRLEWDNGVRTEKVGTLDQFTGGGGSSYLKSNGEPSSEARIMVPEGYAWLRAGQPGSQFQAIGILTQDVEVAITLSTLPSGAAVAPDHIYTEFLLRLGGVHFLTPSAN